MCAAVLYKGQPQADWQLSSALSSLLVPYMLGAAACSPQAGHAASFRLAFTVRVACSMPRVSGTDDAMAYPTRTGQLCLSLELRPGRAVHARLVERSQPCYHSRRSLSELVGWSSVDRRQSARGTRRRAFRESDPPPWIRRPGIRGRAPYFPRLAELTDLLS